MALVTEPAMDGTSLKSLMINNGEEKIFLNSCQETRLGGNCVAAKAGRLLRSN